MNRTQRRKTPKENEQLKHTDPSAPKPRTIIKSIKLVNHFVLQMIAEKDITVKEAKKIHTEIEKIDAKIEESRKRQHLITNNCNPTELIEKGNKLRDEINVKMQELEDLGKEINATKLAAIPEKEVLLWKELHAQKEKKERVRNKLVLRVQKLKDRFIPLIQKEAKPYLGKFEDLETAEAKGDYIVVKIFDHQIEWEKNFKPR